MNANPAQSSTATHTHTKVISKKPRLTYDRITPRRQIGPDAITMLRQVSKQRTGNRYTFDACRVQRNERGHPATELDFDNMEIVRASHPDSYGCFIHTEVIPEAKKWEARLEGADPSYIKHTLNTLLGQSRCVDTTLWWVCSTYEIRKLLFPEAYTDEGKRIDHVFYLDRRSDRLHRGKAVFLSKLSRADNQRFVDYATRLINEPFDPATITPFNRESTHTS